MDTNTFVMWAEFPDYNVPQYSRRVTNKWIDAGTFPPPVRISASRIAWKLRDLEIWKATRPPAHEPPPVLWAPRIPERGRGMVTFTRRVGRRRGSRMVGGVLLSPEAVAALGAGDGA